MVSVIKHNTPALRFEGFDGEWDTPSLGDLGVPVSGVGFPHSEQGGEAGVPFFKVSDMGRSANERELLFAANYVSAEQIRKRGWQVVNGPAVVFAKVGAAVLLDRKRLVREQFLADNNMMALVLSQTALTPDFALSLFGTIRLSSLVQVGALPSINGSQVKAMQVSIPASLEEQHSIGELFADLDALIEQHRAKHANLQQTKTALMQRMFPQGGADEPELRLDGFSGAWEATEVKHVAARAIGGGTPSRSAPGYWNGSIPWIQSSDVKEHTVFGCTPKHFISSRGLASSATSLVKGGSIAVVTRVGVGKVAIMTEDYCSSQDFLNLSGLQGDLTFLGVLLQSELEKMSSQTQGTSIKGVTKEDVMSLSIQVPPALEEQGAIGEVFTNLDALIAAEHRYITQLTQAKTALLQCMFV